MAVTFTTKRVEGFQEAIEDARKSWNSVSDGLGQEDEKLMRKLSSCKIGSGHDAFLKCIIAWYDVKAGHSFIPQLYRYHFRDTVSSTSKMHMTKGGKVKYINPEQCNSFVHVDALNAVNRMIYAYNEDNLRDDVWEGCKTPTTKKEMFEAIIMNIPIGYELTFGEVTNYLQLKTMYAQRKNHKMSGWSTEFVRWVKTLPYSWLITGGEND